MARTVVSQPRENQIICRRVVLVGDAGAHRKQDHVLPAVQTSIIPHKTSIVFLGDNIYPAGFPINSENNSNLLRQARERLLAQTVLVSNGLAEAIFIPGNHDWANGGVEGWNAVRREGEIISAQPNCRLLPSDGNPGPVTMETNGVRLIILDTQWWLHRHLKPRQSTAAVITQLAKEVANAGTNRLLIVGHHPLRTYGLHAGYYSWKNWIFPLGNTKAEWLWLPGPGIYPLVRSFRRDAQDIWSKPNRVMRQQILASLDDANRWIYVSGHDHSLQVIDRAPGQLLLVSGAGSPRKVRSSAVWHGSDSLFAARKPGFMILDYLCDGEVVLFVIDATKERARVMFSMQVPVRRAFSRATQTK